MESITKVAPYALPPNSKLLSVLKPVSFIDSDTIQPEVRASIPVFADVNVSSIVSANTQKLLTKKSLETKNTAVDEEPEEDIGQENEVPEKYLEINHLIPKTKKDQLTTVILQNFPNLKNIAIEKILNVFIPQDFKWSHLSHDIIDNKLIFIKFNHLKALKRFYAFKDILPNIFEAAVIFIDPQAGHYLDNLDEENVKINEKSVNAKINQILQSNIGKSLKSGTEDLDAVLNYYSKYEVDDNELIDVPNNMKEMIVKEIIKFRSRVLIIERDNRKKEIEEERIKSKERLKQIFQGIQNEDTNMLDSSEVDSNNLQLEQEYEHMNEQEYEQYLKENEEGNLERSYQEKLKQMEILEIEKDALEKKLESLNNYETTLIDNKFKFIEDIIAIQDKDQKKLLQLPKDNSLASIVKLYYSDHSQYLKLRTQKRTLEEAQDKLDREAEDKDLQSNEEANEFMANIKKPKIDNPEGTKDVEINISKLSHETNSKLQYKIIELVEEYLGIKDTFLINVINENISNNNLSGKQDLVNDLTEVLDDDAVNLVNDLWSFIQSLV